MKKLVLRKGKKELANYTTAYDFAEDTETLKKYFPQNYQSVSKFVAQNAFGFAIIRAKARLGNGYILETAKN